MTDDAVRRLRAAAHPLRLRMLSLLTGTELSAAEVARELGVSHANASYHLRRLLDAGELVVAGEEEIRGGVAKRYRHPWRAVADREQPPPGTGTDDQAAYVRAMAAELVRRHDHARLGPPRQFCDAELWVSDGDWSEVRDLVERAGRLLHERARPPRTAGTQKVALTIAAFGLQDTGADSGGDTA